MLRELLHQLVVIACLILEQIRQRAGNQISLKYTLLDLYKSQIRISQRIYVRFLCGVIHRVEIREVNGSINGVQLSPVKTVMA